MKKLIFIATLILYSCNNIIIRPLYIIDNSAYYTESFKIPENYNQVLNAKIKRFNGSCNNPVLVCKQVDAFLNNNKKDTNWPENMYATRLINDSIWEIKVDYITRHTKKGTIYGGGALLYVRKDDGEILYFSKSK